jgi:hypothetical protein
VQLGMLRLPIAVLCTRALTGCAHARAIPALQLLSKACRLEQLDLPGRRAPCEALVARMAQSSTVPTQRCGPQFAGALVARRQPSRPDCAREASATGLSDDDVESRALVA